MLNFDNRFIRELPGDPITTNETRQVTHAAWSSVAPTRVAAPSMLAYSREMAVTLGIDDAAMQSPEMINALSGNELLPGMQPYATCYGGHQFGHWAGQLGDGRAIYLGEAINAAGERWEMQLKGAGPTPYSRRADGRAVLRSSIREFLCSEAMHHLGIPTTRALSLVATGDKVVRDMFYDGNPQAEQGAIVCRVAPSFTRFGHFEIFAARGETDLLLKLVDFTINRDFPHLAHLQSKPEKHAAWFSEVCECTALMIVGWMQVGFVHGVMNTDNMSILGLTIDYGPYGWVDNFDPGWTPNTTDAGGKRYAFGRQPEIARWNLERLADALGSVFADDSALAAGLERYDEIYNSEFNRVFAQKFGLKQLQGDDGDLINDVFALMQEAEVDMTEFFRQLAEIEMSKPSVDVLQSAFYSQEKLQQFRPEFAAWLARYVLRVNEDAQPHAQRVSAMNQVNPRYVLRNYLAQQAIDKAEQGDVSMIYELLDVIRKPYALQPGLDAFAAKRPDWARHKAGCSMLSCSS
jgi:serine/tyrosine/threonine adenylyltransferase